MELAVKPPKVGTTNSSFFNENFHICHFQHLCFCDLEISTKGSHYAMMERSKEYACAHKWQRKLEGVCSYTTLIRACI